MQTPIDRVVDAHRSLLDARRELFEAIKEARDSGETWASIGKALGVSRQAAFTNFRKLSYEQPER